MKQSEHFQAAFDWVVGIEGGFTNDPQDPGNWSGGAVGVGSLVGTKWGISAGAFPGIDVAQLTRDDASVLYHQHYWLPSGCACLVPALALMVLDSAVNSGVAAGVRWLQQALGIGVDGVAGPLTQAAAGAACFSLVGSELLARRMYALAQMPDWAIFGLGWARRLARLALAAAVLNASAPGATAG
ncbi:MAG: glycosyl hydrolase 108 family protein [Acidocella sp.]|nr:glycosyl hydrolase 108 family protein [Acidocella sp.]